MCISANEKYNINELLNEIISNNIYKNDFEQITSKIVYEDIEYKDIENTIIKIANKNIF